MLKTSQDWKRGEDRKEERIGKRRGGKRRIGKGRGGERRGREGIFQLWHSTHK